MTRYTRRSFLKFSTLAALATSASCRPMEVTSDKQHIERTEVDIAVKELPDAFNNYRIGFLSDIHLGIALPQKMLEAALSHIENAQVDIFLLGGDYIWIPKSRLEKLLRVVRNKKIAEANYETVENDIYEILTQSIAQVKTPDGTYGVLGNHDTWSNPELAVRAFKKRNLGLLVNESVIIRRDDKFLRIYGTDDFWSGIPSLKGLPEKKEENETRCILTHNPDYLSDILEKSDFEFDLGLAGHTHGGQIKLPLFGALTYNVRDLRFSEGLYRHKKASVYTTRGLGYVELPYRVNCPPEVTILTLKRA